MRKINLIFLFVFILFGCGKNTKDYRELEFKNRDREAYDNGKPYSGIVTKEESGKSAEYKDGKFIKFTKQKKNGYKKIEHSDGSKEYYDYNNNRISKEEYYNN